MADPILYKSESTDRTLYIGTSGYGKSNGIFDYVDGLRKRHIPFLIWDHDNEYGGLQGVKYIRSPCKSPHKMLDFNTPIIIQPGGTLEYRQRILDNLLDDLLKHPRKTIPWVIIIEEGHNYAPATKRPVCKDNMMTLYKEGRKRGYGCITVTQNILGIDSEMILEARQILSFKLVFSTPYLEKKLIRMTNKKDILDRCRALQVGQALMMTQHGTIEGPLNFPHRKDKTGGQTLKTQSVNPRLQDLDTYLGTTTPKKQPARPKPKEENPFMIAGIAIFLVILIIGAMIGLLYHFTKEDPKEVHQHVQTNNYNTPR